MQISEKWFVEERSLKNYVLLNVLSRDCFVPRNDGLIIDV